VHPVVEQHLEHLPVQGVHLVVLGLQFGGQRRVTGLQHTRHLPGQPLGDLGHLASHVRYFRWHRGDRMAHEGDLRDVLGQRAHPLEVGRDMQARQREPQVRGDRLLANEQFDDGLLDLLPAAPDRGGDLERLGRRGQVSFEQAGGGPAHAGGHFGAHDDERAAKRVELFPERCAHATPIE
jgi:hypothetical protein